MAKAGKGNAFCTRIFGHGMKSNGLVYSYLIPVGKNTNRSSEVSVNSAVRFGKGNSVVEQSKLPDIWRVGLH